LVVMGCIAGISGDRLRERFDAVIIPPSRMADFDALIGASMPIGDAPDPNAIDPIIERASRSFKYTDLKPGDAARRFVRTTLAKRGLRDWMAEHGRVISESYAQPGVQHFSLRVARGCLSECTYCAIRIASGPLRSKPLADVLGEFDIGLVALLSAILERPGSYSLTMNDFNVGWLSRYQERIVPLLADHASRIAHMAIPTQSGSDRVLTLMKRGNTAAGAKAALVSLRQAAPGLQMSTHVLVGFPGETDEDFQQTIDLLGAARFNRIDVFAYSDRPGTPASTMPSRVANRVVASRIRQVRREFPGVVCVTR